MAEAATELAKPSNGNKASGAAEFTDFGIEIQSGKNHAYKDQNKRTPDSGSFLVCAQVFRKVLDPLSEDADKSSCQKGFYHVHRKTVRGCDLFHVLFVLFLFF